MAAWLRKTTALALVGALIGVSPGPSAALEVAAALHGVPALPSAAIGSAAAGSAALSIVPSLSFSPAPAFGAAPTVPSLIPAAVLLPAVPSSPAAAVAPARAAAAVLVPHKSDTAATRPSGLARLTSAAASAPNFGGRSAAAASIKADAGRDFDLSAAAPASQTADPVSSSALETASPSHDGGLSKAGPRGPRGPPAGPPASSGAPKNSRGLARWLGVGIAGLAVVAHPHWAALALAGVAVPSYYFANGAGILFPLIQVHEIFKRRSADVSSTTLVTGIVASLLLAVNFSYMGVGFAALQNLAGALTFGFIAAQKYWYARRPASAAAPQGRGAAAAKTVLAVAALGGLTLALGKVMLAVLPGVALAGSLLVPFQVLSGLGFAYLMLPEYLKIKRNQSVGDSSRGMALTYWACIIASGLWGLNMLVTLPTSSAAANILPVLAFTAVAYPLSAAIVRWTASRSWAFIPDHLRVGRWTLSRENMINLASFLVLAPFMLAAVGAGALFLGHMLPIAAGSMHQFMAYLLYLMSNVLGAVVTIGTLRAFKEHAPKKDSLKP